MCRTMNAESAGLDLGAWGANSPVRATCDVANREHMASVCVDCVVSRPCPLWRVGEEPPLWLGVPPVRVVRATCACRTNTRDGAGRTQLVALSRLDTGGSD